MKDKIKIYILHSFLILFAAITTFSMLYFFVVNAVFASIWWVIIAALLGFILCIASLHSIHKILQSNANMIKSIQLYADKLKESQDELQHVLNCLEPGVVKIIFDSASHRTIAWANDGFFDLSGYGREGYAVMGEAHNIVHPDDMEWVFKAFTDHAQMHDKLSITYRIIHKNGSIVWLHVTSNYVGKDNGNPVFIAIMMDITSQKNMRDKLLLEQQRYTLINSLSDEILFEYDLASDTLTTYGNSSQLLGENPIIPQFSKRLEKPRSVHPDDAHVLGDMLQLLKNAAPIFTPKFRLKLGNKDGYQWHSACYSVIEDGNGSPALIVGKLVNIHESAILIKNLQVKLDMDGMTDLYNKTSFEKYVNAEVKNTSLGQHAFLVIDIDDFKSINDTYGHPYGDEVIKAVAQMLKNSFRTTDRIGRAGGDEFAVLMRDIKERQVVEERIEAFYAELRTLRILPHHSVHISASIGVALYPQHGKNYEQLFIQADHALYNVKRNGKGRFFFRDTETQPTQTALP